MTAAAETASPHAATSSAGPGPGGRGRVRRRGPRSGGRARWWLGTGLLVLAGAVLAGLLSSQPGNTYLSPASASGTGAHALADILTGLGRQVTPVTSASAAATSAQAGTTLVITSPYFLTGRQLAALARVPADILLVEPDARALAAFRTGFSLATSGAPVSDAAAACTLYPAVLAGTADAGDMLFSPEPDAVAQQCYPVQGDPSLVQLTAGGRIITLLGSGYPMTNAGLPRQGNAALMLNLLSARRIIWLVPPVTAITAGLPGGSRSLPALIPLAAYLIVIQLGIALLLTAVWRARRLGPLVAEPLPVVVRAAETIEGHGRLYQSRRAREHAAGALREALIRRVGPRAGLPAGAVPPVVVAAFASRSARTAPDIERLLFGPAPGSDRALVDLARELDEFEREVSTS